MKSFPTRSVIGLDIGTTAIKCVLLSEEGKVIASASVENQYFESHGGRVEFDAAERFESICELINSMAGKKAGDTVISGLCISGASGNALLLDANKQPLMNAVSWLDQRAALTYSELVPFSPNYVFNVCGWPLTGSFPLSFFAWMKNKETVLYNKAHYYATDFIFYNYKLSGNWLIDISTATNFYLIEQASRRYHQPFLDFLDVEERQLPEIVNSGSILGYITEEASKRIQLPEGTPVIGGSFDHPAAARGTGVLCEGDMLLSCGTSWVLFTPVSDREKALSNQMLVDSFLQPEGPWGGMMSFTAIGKTIDSYINLLFPDTADRFAEFDEAVMASYNLPETCEFNLLQQECTHQNYIDNLLTQYGLPCVCRSITDNLASHIQQKVGSLKKEGLDIRNLLMVGGFSESKVWPQLLANRLNIPIHLTDGAYAGCLGACILAGIGIGWWKNEQEGYDHLHLAPRIILPDKVAVNPDKH
jgi:sugar (pentulose or hexulose) kinase